MPVHPGLYGQEVHLPALGYDGLDGPPGLGVAGQAEMVGPQVGQASGRAWVNQTGAQQRLLGFQGDRPRVEFHRYTVIA